MTTDRDTELSRGFSAGNFANAYETESLEIALEARCEDRSEDYVHAFILGFYATYGLHEIPGSHRDQFDEAYWSEAGQRVIELGYCDPRGEDKQ